MQVDKNATQDNTRYGLITRLSGLGLSGLAIPLLS
jgi:hypothetical protein